MDALAHVGCDFLYELLAWIYRIDRGPAAAQQKPNRSDHKTEGSKTESNDEARRIRSFFGNAGSIDHADDGNVFGFFDSRQFVLLGEEFEDRFLDADTAIEVGIGDGETWELP